MKKVFFVGLFFIFVFNSQAYAGIYSFLFGIPDSVIIGDDETGISFPGRIINNGDYPMRITGIGTGNIPAYSSSDPWWSSNYWDFNIQGHYSDIQPGETLDFQLGIFRDDPQIDRDNQYLRAFFVLADLDGDSKIDAGTPWQYYDSNGWIFDEMAKTSITFGDTFYLSPNYYYVESTLSPNFTPNVIPEPSSLFLLSLGLLGAGLFKKRHRKNE